MESTEGSRVKKTKLRTTDIKATRVRSGIPSSAIQVPVGNSGQTSKSNIGGTSSRAVKPKSASTKRVPTSKPFVQSSTAVSAAYNKTVRSKDATSSSGSVDLKGARFLRDSKNSPNNISSGDQSQKATNKSFQFGHQNALMSCSSGGDSSQRAVN